MDETFPLDAEQTSTSTLGSSMALAVWTCGAVFISEGHRNVSRFVIEQPCPVCGKHEHAQSEDAAHFYEAPMRTVIDPSDPHRIEAAARAVAKVRNSSDWKWFQPEASAAIAAFLDPF